MTTPNNDNQNLDQANGADGADEANDGFTDPDESQAGVPDADAAKDGQDEDKPDAADAAGNKPDAAVDGAEKVSDADHWKQQAKQYRDKSSVAKQESGVLRKVVLKLEAEGLLDRDEIAKEVGEDRKFIDAIIDRTELPEPGEDAHMAEVARQMDEDFRNPAIQKALVRVYGDTKKQEELAKAFNFALQGNEALKEKYENVKPEDALYFVLDEGKAALDDYLEFQNTGGNAKALAAENRALKAEIAELKKPKPVNTQAKDDEDEPNAEERTIPEPKNAREARVRLFMN